MTSVGNTADFVVSDAVVANGDDASDFKTAVIQSLLAAGTVADNGTIQYNTTVLPSVNTIARRMFCGAKNTHHTFIPTIKH